METFSALLAICAENSSVSGDFPARRPVTRSFDVFFDLRLNKRLSKQWWGWWFETPSRSVWRHRNDKTQWNICQHMCKVILISISGMFCYLLQKGNDGYPRYKITDNQLHKLWLYKPPRDFSVAIHGYDILSNKSFVFWKVHFQEEICRAGPYPGKVYRNTNNVRGVSMTFIKSYEV